MQGRSQKGGKEGLHVVALSNAGSEAHAAKTELLLGENLAAFAGLANYMPSQHLRLLMHLHMFMT